jgi:hypothetical protein
MTVISDLDAKGRRLLELLVKKLVSARLDDPRTFVSYKDVHDDLDLPKERETYGESLKEHGLVSLAEWTFRTDKPAITGLIIDRHTCMPGKGYFDLFGRKSDDFVWWMAEIVKSKNYDWSKYLPAVKPPEPPIAIDLNVPPERKKATITRIIRDSALARRIKQLHDYKCQLCDHTIQLADGSRYAEAHHIQPLGEPHNGPDIPENLVCVCPNHHAELDFGGRSLALADFRQVSGHAVAEAYVEYHNAYVRRGS